MTPLIKAGWYALEIEHSHVIRTKREQVLYCMFRVLDGRFEGYVFPNSFGVLPGGRTVISQLFKSLGLRNYLPQVIGDPQSTLGGKRLCARVELRVEPHLIYPCITEMYPYDCVVQHSRNLCG